MFYSLTSFSQLKSNQAALSPGGSGFADTTSFLFDGVDDYIDCGSYTALDTTDTFSISMWVKIGGGGYVVGKNNTASYWGMKFAFYITQSKIEVYTDNIAFRNTTLTLGSNWIHVVMVIDRTESATINRCKIYVDDTPITNVTYSSFAQVSADSSPLIIGARQVGMATPVINGSFGGNMDEVSIWSNALQPSDITTIYNSGVPNDISAMSGLNNWWRMGEEATWDGARDWTLVDEGSGGNNGTTQNMAEASRTTDVPT